MRNVPVHIAHQSLGGHFRQSFSDKQDLRILLSVPFVSTFMDSQNTKRFSLDGRKSKDFIPPSKIKLV